MNKYTGKSVFGGIAIGKIMVYEKGEHQVKRVKITDAEAEKNVVIVGRTLVVIIIMKL